MIVYDVATKVLYTNLFTQQNYYHRCHGLWHYIYYFVQSGEAFTAKGNKHTHASAVIADMSENYAWITPSQQSTV